MASSVTPADMLNHRTCPKCLAVGALVGIGIVTDPVEPTFTTCTTRVHLVCEHPACSGPLSIQFPPPQLEAVSAHWGLSLPQPRPEPLSGPVTDADVVDNGLVIVYGDGELFESVRARMGVAGLVLCFDPRATPRPGVLTDPADLIGLNDAVEGWTSHASCGVLLVEGERDKFLPEAERWERDCLMPCVDAIANVMNTRFALNVQSICNSLMNLDHYTGLAGLRHGVAE